MLKNSTTAFGWSVALSGDGNTAMVGTPDYAGSSGGVWAYTRSGASWTQQGPILVGIGEMGVAEFGNEIAISRDGNTAAIAARDDGGSTAGAIYVFARSGGTWTQQGPRLAGGGESIAISADGNTVVSGNQNADDAYVFERSGETWTRVAQLVPSNHSPYVGSSVAISGDGSTVLVGDEFEESNHGGVWEFARHGGSWSQEGERHPPEPGGGLFGEGVALSADGSTAFVVDSAATHVYELSGAQWTLEATLPSGAAAISADGEVALIGSGSAKGNLGEAFAFDREGSSWIGFGTPLVGGSEENNKNVFGFSLGLSSDGTTALVGSLSGAWVFVNGPTVTGVAPDEEPDAGGTAVTIGGSGFGAATAVAFGSTPAASFHVASDHTIEAVAPAGGAGSVDVTVTSPEGTSPATPADHFTYGPIVKSVSPAAGVPGGGTHIAITGEGLAGASAVSFGGQPAASFEVISGDEVQAVSPPGSGTVDVTVTTPEGTSEPRAADEFTYVPPPAVTSIEHNVGVPAGGARMAIFGSHFREVSAVSFGGTPATSFEVLSETEISTITPTGTGTVDVTVTTPYGTSAIVPSDSFRYLAPPEIGRCLRNTVGINSYTNAGCTTPSPTGASAARYGWEPASGGGDELVKPRFSAVSKAGSEPKLVVAHGTLITCKAVSNSGEYAGPASVADVTIRFTGCRMGASTPCSSAGAAEGEVALESLVGELGVVAVNSVQTKDKIGLRLHPAAGEALGEFTCGVVPVVLSGSMINEVKSDAMVSVLPWKYAQTKVVQKPAKFEGGPPSVLSVSVGGGPPEPVGLVVLGTQTNEEKVEINPVV
jgi:hypothetical protein